MCPLPACCPANPMIDIFYAVFAEFCAQKHNVWEIVQQAWKLSLVLILGR